MNDNADFKKTIDAYRARQGHFQLLEVPDLQYLMVDGDSDPNTSPAYVEAIAALYPLAYALKFASIRDLARDYVVMPIEGLWWAENLDSFTAARDKSIYLSDPRKTAPEKLRTILRQPVKNLAPSGSSDAA